MLEWIVRRPALTILIIVVVTFFFAWQIPTLSIRTSIYDLVIQDLPETARYNEFKKIFGSDEILRVVIKGENVFDPVTFRKVEELAETAAKINGIRRVISLPGIKKDIEVSGKWDLTGFATVLTPVDLFQKNLISTDRKTTVLTLVLEAQADNEAVIQEVQELISGVTKDLSLYQIGMPLVSQAMAKFTEKDFFRLPPITFLLITLILLLLFRNFASIILPLTCVMFSLVWTFGLMALTDVPLSMLTMIVPVFLIAVGTAYCLHIGSEYLSCTQQVRSRTEAVFATFSSISPPTALAVFTTVVGLGSLLVNRIVAIREFAIFSCFGMVSLLVLVLTLFPAALILFPLPEKRQKDPLGIPEPFERFLDWIVRLDLNHQKITLPILAFLVVICLVGIFRIQVETSPIEFFKSDTPISRHFHDIYQDLSGSFPVNVVIAGGEDYFESSEHIREVARLQESLETLPGVDKTVSFTDYLKLVNYATNRFESEHYSIPGEDFEIRMLFNNYRMLLGEDMVSSFITPDFSQINILLLTHLASSREFLEVRDKIIIAVKQQFSKDLEVDVTGLGMVVSASSHLLTKGQIKSLSLTVVLVFAIMFMLFLSAKVGLIAIVTNFFPIVINFGVMGWLGVELSMVTSLIASIAIGLAVDDTIHYLVRFNREFKIHLDDKMALKETIKQVGRPIVFTTLTISMGFSILMFSNFRPTAIFGVMMVITMVSALVGDLILLPSLMLHVELVTLWDLVRVKLGRDPQEGIPVFEGLSSTQVHYILAAGSIKMVDAGEVLFRKGDPSDFMYALLSGTLNVVDPLSDEDLEKAPGVRKLITQLHSGDLVGEMGLLRSAPRSATVIAAKPGELLQINWKMIRRLQWLFPPAAHRFFYNLMRIVCDRLESSTQSLTEASRVDDLTGLCNSKGFMEILEKEIHRARRYNSHLSLCLIGVDFRLANPHAAYDTKDQLLSHLTKTLAVQIRKSDTLGRLDAQKLALLLPHTSISEAEQIRDRLLQPLDQGLFDAAEVSVFVTLGVAGMLDEGDDLGLDLLARAEGALEAAKKSGKERLLPTWTLDDRLKGPSGGK